MTRALTLVGIEPDGWTVDEPAHSRWLSPNVWDITRGDERLIVKDLPADRPTGSNAIERHWTHDSGRPHRWNYWAREALAYESRLVDAFGPGLQPPGLRAVAIDDERTVLAIEYVSGTPAEDWEITEYGEVAHALGLGQAPFLNGEPGPSAEWLSQGFLRTYSSEWPVDYELFDDDGIWNHPIVAEAFPADLRAAATELHGRRERLYEIVEALPRTLSHLDFWTKNLLRRDDGGFVLIDWAFVGDGAIGEDVGNLVPDAAFDLFIEPERLPELRQLVLDGYVAGLRAGGWDGDERLAELGMAASAVKYRWLTPLMLMRVSAAEHRTYGGAERIDAIDLYRKRGAALLDNALVGLRALDLAAELGL